MQVALKNSHDSSQTPKLKEAPASEPTPSVFSNENSLCGRACCIELRTAVFIILSAVAVAGFALTFFPSLNAKTFNTVAYAVFACLSIYLAKDAYDRQRALEDVTERLENTQTKLDETQKKLGGEVTKLKKVIKDDIGTVVDVLREEGATFHQENEELKQTVTKLDIVVDKITPNSGDKKPYMSNTSLEIGPTNKA